MEPEWSDPDAKDPKHGWNENADRTLHRWMNKTRANYNMHVDASSLYTKLRLALYIPVMILAAFTGIQGIDSAFDNQKCLSKSQFVLQIITSISSLIVAALSAIHAYLAPGEKETAHKNASDDYSELVMKLRTECDRPFSKRTSHAILMHQIAQDISKINREVHPLPEKITKKYQSYIENIDKSQRADMNAIPDIIIPMGRRLIGQGMAPSRAPPFSSPSPHKEPSLESKSDDERSSPKGSEDGSETGSKRPNYNPEEDEEGGLPLPSLPLDPLDSVDPFDSPLHVQEGEIHLNDGGLFH